MTKKIYILRLALAMLLFVFLPQNAMADTLVSGLISTDTVWTESNSPYVVTDSLTVDVGKTLEIREGVVVKFRGVYSFIEVNGTLNVRGATTSKVYFTSINDDSVGGDTNGDGSSSLPNPGNWKGIQFNLGSNGSLSHAVVRYGGYVYFTAELYAGIYNNGGNVSVSNSLISDNGSYGFRQSSGSLTVDFSEISNSEVAVLVEGGSFGISDSKIHNNSYGVVSFSGSLSVNNNIFVNNTNLGFMNPNSNFIHNDNIATGSGINAWDVSGRINVNRTFSSGDLPYLISNLSVDFGKTLNLEPGVIFKFKNQTSSLDINGTLNVRGATTSKVYFTSIKDDSVGGDTNGDGSSSLPNPGNWKGIQFNFGSTGNIQHADIKYGGYLYYTAELYAGVHNNGGNLIISNSNISQNNIVGFRQLSGSANITSSQFSREEIGIMIEGGSLYISNSYINNNTHGINVLSGFAQINNNVFESNQLVGLVYPNVNFIHNLNSAIGSGLKGWDITGELNTNKILSSNDLPYIVRGLTVSQGSKLTINSGSVLKFHGQYSNIIVNGELSVLGATTSKVYFTSIKDDSVGGDTNGDGSSTIPIPSNWTGIEFNTGSVGKISNADIKYAGYGYFTSEPFSGLYNNGGNISLNNSKISSSSIYGLRQKSGSLTVTFSEFSSNEIGVYINSGSANITQSNILNNSLGLFNDSNNILVNATNNYWGDVTGPYNLSQNLTGLGNRVSDNVSFVPWLQNLATSTPVGCISNCFSNVMFFPGVMGSKLYDAQDELWVTTGDSKQARLVLDTLGKSANTVFTKDDTQSISDEAETGIVDEVLGTNIYNTFINSLKDWKTEGVYNDYAFIPYDWRLSLSDIITFGATTTSGNLSYTNTQNFSESFILKKLEELQKSSKSGKVTLIGHSNGGMVIKALVQKLKDTNNPMYDKIDKIIFVAVPQVGTPDAIVSLLHGSSLGKGFVMRNERLRGLAENMSTVYNLLPTNGYFTTVDPAFEIDKVVSFQNVPEYSSQISQYGVFVSNQTELKDYILGTDARTKPAYSDTSSPNIGNSGLYSDAQAVHNVLDNWSPASTTKVIQVAGWGEETLAGISYKKCADKSVQGFYKCFKPNMVVDGDGTVVVPSALWMSISTPSVERWWVDLVEYDTISNLEREHKDILEVSNLNDFIKSKIDNSAYTDQNNIVVNNTSTLVSDDTRLHYTLHSPLTLGVLDSQGRYTGLDPITGQVREEIPNVVYKVFGETQFISVPIDIQGTVKLQGLSGGVFALDIEKQTGNTIVEETSFQGIPSSTSTVVALDINSVVASSTLKIDNNSDGVVDVILQARLGEVVLYPKYIWQGFSQPINDTNFNPDQKQSVFKGGSTVPVKFQSKSLSSINSGTMVQASSSPVWLAPRRLSSMLAVVDEPVYSDFATSGNVFKWDPTSNQYIYNWSTKGLATGYWYKLFVKLDDGNVNSVVVGLR